MGFLSSLFSPDPANLFSGDKGDFVNNALDPVGGFLESNPEFDPWGAAGLHEDVGAWMDDLGDTTELLAKSRSRNVHRENMSGEMFKRDAMTGFTGFGGSPIGTRFTNKINANEDRPLWDMYGGSTPEDYQYVASKGQDANAQQGLSAVGGAVGKGFINAFTGGLGSTALDSLNEYGYGNDEALKKSGKEIGTNYLSNYLFGPYAGAAAATAAQGGNRKEIGKSFLQSGALNAAGEYGMEYLKGLFGGDEMPDTGTLGGTMQDEYGENSATMGGEASATQRNANLSLPTDMRMQIQSSSPSNPTAPQGGAVEQFLSSLGISGGPSTGLGMGDYMGLASGLYGMYNANKQRKRLQQQQDSLASMFAPNSPYAQHARQMMERKDAAAGRRSQYGPRETQLAALLADKYASTMPQQMKYADAIGGYDNMMVNNGLGTLGRLYQNRGKIGQDIDGLMRLFGQGGQ